MTLQSDCSIGLKTETTWGTAVTVDHFPEFDKQTLMQSPEYLQGQGLRVGKITPRFARRILGKVVTGGDVELAIASKGFSIFLEAALGSCSPALRSGSIYQHLATPLLSDPMPSYTIQAGVPPVGGGATVAHTFAGSVCDEWELTAKIAEFAMWKATWVGKDLVTATAYAAPSYVTQPRQYTFGQVAIGIGINGTDVLTLPTSTALGSTAAAGNGNITEISVKGKNNVDDGGYVVGAGAKRGRRPVYGVREFTGSFTAEFTSTQLRDMYMAQNNLHAVITFTSDQDNIGGSGTFAAFQIVLPSLALDGDIPVSNGGDIITQTVNFTVLDGEVAALPIYMVMVTSDTMV